MTNSSQALLFAKNFLRHPSMLGSLVPSSRFLVNDLLSQLDWDRARVVVEYGPGVGTITQELLKRMRPDAVLVAIELNPEFVRFLEDEVPDPRLRVVHASASSVREALARFGLGNADYIISGIPFTNIPGAMRLEIMQESRQALQPDGALLVYQFTATVLPYLKSSFTTVRQNFQLWNILPARIFYCTP
ncbi:MAG TPA: rRNA adenine N-6-methyltransferase family protein [Terriglobales bacterium]|jgi:phospholipid N-methyltransferase